MFEVARSRRICCSRVAERQAKGAAAVAIASLTHQTPGHLADVRVTASKEAEAGAAELQRHTEALALADGDVHAQCSRRLSSPSARGSAVTEIASAPARCVISAIVAERLDHSQRIGVAGDGTEQFVVGEGCHRSPVKSARGRVERDINQLQGAERAQVGVNGGAVIGP